MAAPKEQELIQQLALWLLPTKLTPRLIKLWAGGSKPQPLANLSAAAALQLVASNQVFNSKSRQLAEIALHDPWRLPFADLIEKHLAWAASAASSSNNLNTATRHLVYFSALPPQLQAIPDPPILLCVEGNLAELAAPALALVGSRRLSPEGQNLAFNWAQQLAGMGLNILSGLARGVDGFAHQGAVQAKAQGAPATSSAVLAQGLDSIYPPEHKNLAAELVATGGMLISEYPLGHKPLARNFPARNRIVTGLSLGLVVVEAALRSGSLVSARHAMEQGREVMAVPGSVRRPQSAGCHQLIRQGAALVTSPQEILQEISQPLRQLLAQGMPTNLELSAALQHLEAPVAASVTKPKRQPASNNQPTFSQAELISTPNAPLAAEHLQPLLNLISDAPLPTDSLLAALNLNAATGLSQLLELELAGLITQQPGGWVLV